MWWPNAVVVAALLVSATICQEPNPTDEEIRSLLESYNAEAVNLCNAQSTANWNVATNVGNNEYLPAQVRFEIISYSLLVQN